MPKHDPSEKTKSEILKTAASLFHERGWNDVNIEEIVKAVGVTRGAFYHYFKSREDLIYQVFIKNFLSEEFFPVLSKIKGTNALEKIRNAFKSYLSDVANISKSGFAFGKAWDSDPLVYKSNSVFLFDIIAPNLEKLLIEGTKDGSTPVKYPKHTAQAIAMMLDDWINITVLRMTSEEFAERLLFLEDFLGKLSAPIMDDEIKRMLTQIYEQTRKK